MGFLATDLTVLNSNGPTTLIPTSKDLVVKAFKVARTDTTAALKAVLPGDASIVNIDIFGTASDAGTTATLSIGTSTTSTEIISGQSVLTGGKVAITTAWSVNFPNVQPVPVTGDIKLYAKYAETGTASTAGGDWTVVVYYVR